MEIELTYRAEMALYRLFGIKGTSYAENFFYHVAGDISQAKSLPTPALIGNFSLVILMHGFFYLGRSYITKNSHVGKHYSLSLLNYADLLQSPHADPLYSFRASVVRYLFCITSHNACRGGQYS